MHESGFASRVIASAMLIGCGGAPTIVASSPAPEADPLPVVATPSLVRARSTPLSGCLSNGLCVENRHVDGFNFIAGDVAVVSLESAVALWDGSSWHFQELAAGPHPQFVGTRLENLTAVFAHPNVLWRWQNGAWQVWHTTEQPFPGLSMVGDDIQIRTTSGPTSRERYGLIRDGGEVGSCGASFTMLGQATCVEVERADAGKFVVHITSGSSPERRVEVEAFRVVREDTEETDETGAPRVVVVFSRDAAFRSDAEDRSYHVLAIGADDVEQYDAVIPAQTEEGRSGICLTARGAMRCTESPNPRAFVWSTDYDGDSWIVSYESGVYYFDADNAARGVLHTAPAPLGTVVSISRGVPYAVGLEGAPHGRTEDSSAQLSTVLIYRLRDGAWVLESRLTSAVRFSAPDLVVRDFAAARLLIRRDLHASALYRVEGDRVVPFLEESQTLRYTGARFLMDSTEALAWFASHNTFYELNVAEGRVSEIAPPACSVTRSTPFGHRSDATMSRRTRSNVLEWATCGADVATFSHGRWSGYAPIAAPGAFRNIDHGPHGVARAWTEHGWQTLRGHDFGAPACDVVGANDEVYCLAPSCLLRLVDGAWHFVAATAGAARDLRLLHDGDADPELWRFATTTTAVRWTSDRTYVEATTPPGSGNIIEVWELSDGSGDAFATTDRGDGCRLHLVGNSVEVSNVGHAGLWHVENGVALAYRPPMVSRLDGTSLTPLASVQSEPTLSVSSGTYVFDERVYLESNGHVVRAVTSAQEMLTHGIVVENDELRRLDSEADRVLLRTFVCRGCLAHLASKRVFPEGMNIRSGVVHFAEGLATYLELSETETRDYNTAVTNGRIAWFQQVAIELRTGDAVANPLPPPDNTRPLEGTTRAASIHGRVALLGEPLLGWMLFRDDRGHFVLVEPNNETAHELAAGDSFAEDFVAVGVPPNSFDYLICGGDESDHCERHPLPDAVAAIVRAARRRR